MIRFDKQKSIYYSDLINNKNYIAGFGTRYSNDLVPIFQNVEHRYKMVAVPVQTHSTNIETLTVISDSSDLGTFPNCDGLVSNKAEVALTIKTADCVPIIFVDEKNGVFGISHQGWKGTIGRMPAKMIQKMIAAGAKKEHIIAAIGPCIGSCCYNIELERVEIFYKEFPRYFEKIITHKDEKQYLNLLYTNYRILLDAGISRSQIDYFPFCTQCNEDKFFSFRRDKGIHGNLISFIMKI